MSWRAPLVVLERAHDERPTLTPEAAILQALAETATEWGSSRFAAFRRCAREHQLRYHLNVLPRGRALHFGVGSLVHAGLRYVQEGVMAGEPEPRNVDTLIQAAAAMPDSSPEACDEAARLLHWYFEHWGLENAGWPAEARIIGCEIEWRDDTSFGLPYTGRADTVLEVAGEVLIVDTKTRARSLPKIEDRSDYAKKLATRPQFLGLSHLARKALGLDYYPSLWVNAICKLKMPTFGRVLVQFRPEQVERWAAEQQLACEHHSPGDGYPATHPMTSALTHAPMNFDACAPEMGYGCAYFNWCHGSDETRALHYTQEEQGK